MHRLDSARARVLPAILVAAGVAAVTAGLVSLPEETAAPLPDVSPSATLRAAAPSATASASPPLASLSPRPRPSLRPSATPPANRVATRVAVPALDIDLPIVVPPGGQDVYPLCGVAMYIQQLGQPGQGRATYLYAHAREGMFLPLLTQSEQRDGAGMLGMVVQVWTNDEQLFLYEITEVRRHVTDLDDAVAADHDQLWLQTSEGPRGTVPKLQVVAEPLSSGPAAKPADAHPVPRPAECG